MAMQLVPSEPAEGECWGVRTTNDDCSCIAEVCYDRAVLVCNQIFLQLQTIRVCIACLINVDFNCNRHTSQAAWVFTTLNCLVYQLSRVLGVLTSFNDNRIKFSVDCLQAIKRRLRDFSSRHLARFYQSCDFSRTFLP